MILFQNIYNRVTEYKTHNQPGIRTFIDITEAAAVVILFIFSIILVRHLFIPSWEFDHAQLAFFSFFIVVSWYVLSRITSMAKLPRTQRYRTIIFQHVRVNFIVLTGLIALKYLFNLQSIPLIFIFLYTGLNVTFTIFIRIAIYHTLKIYRANGYDLHNVLIIADGFSDEMIEKLIEQKEWGFNITGIITKSRLIKAKYGKDFTIYPDTYNLTAILDNNIIDEVLYCKGQIDENKIKEIVKICNEVGTIFRLQSTVSPLDPLHLQLKAKNPSRYLTLVDIPSNHLSLVLKTMGDIYFSITAIILFAPLLLLIAILIKLDSRGPILFKQQRIGLRGRKFNLFKFRTMVINAEELLEKLRERNEMDGPTFKLKHDPRITRIGVFLRKTGLDEVPQLFNVIRGEMSLIGPRPPLESEVMKYKRWQLRRLSVKPGITCSWQVIPNRNDVKFERWMKMDLNYIDNWTIGKDFKLLFKTIFVIFSAQGR